MRLYRCEARTGEGRRGAADPESWIWQGMVASGAWDATGRWFVEDPSMLEWYARDCDGGFRIVSVEVDEALAEEWRVSRNPEARRFSRDWENEFFLPREAAESAQPDDAMTAEVAAYLTGGASCPSP